MQNVDLKLLFIVAGATMAIFLLGAVVDAWFYWHRGQRYPWRESYVSIACVLIDIPVALAVGAVLGRDLGPRGMDFTINAFKISHYSGFEFRWTDFLAVFLFQDFFFYITHRLYHASNLFWVYHSTHHAAEEMHFFLGLRLGIFRYASVALWRLALEVPFWLLGFPVILTKAGSGLVFFYQSFLHFEHFPRLGWLDRVLITPSNHRVHHATNLGPTRNFGGITTLWDHLFGTFLDEPVGVKKVYGIGAPRTEIHRPLALQFIVVRDLWRRLRGETGLVRRAKILLGNGELAPVRSKAEKQIHQI